MKEKYIWKVQVACNRKINNEKDNQETSRKRLTRQA
jgi:hypothetical protein